MKLRGNWIRLANLVAPGIIFFIMFIMEKHVVFFQGGGGQKDHDADAGMVASLISNLGTTYIVHYPVLLNEKAPDYGRHKQISHEISIKGDGVILAGHSFGASMLLKYFSENRITKKIEGVVLISTPFWSGDEDWVKPFKLHKDVAERLNKKIPLFFYHSHPFSFEVTG